MILRSPSGPRGEAAYKKTVDENTQEFPGCYFIAMAWAKNGLGRKGIRMRKNFYRGKFFPMNLQFFAEGGDGAGAEEGNGGGSGGNDGAGNSPGSDGKDGTTAPSFDDLLKDGHQAEFDRRLQKGIDTAISKAQEKWQALTDDKLSEAEKLAKMNKEEKADYLRKKQEKDLSDRESAVTRKELMAEAKNTLAEKKLPAGLAEVLNYADADSCSKSITAVEKAFQEAVQTAVEEKLRGGTPPKKAPSGGEDLAKQVEDLMMGY